MALLLTQALRYVTSHGSSTDDEKHDVGHALPLVASPVNPEAYAWLKHQTYTEALVPGKVRRSRTVAHYEAQQGTDSKLARAIFRKQKEASSLELFFDLFFVANLAIFTDVHKHIDGVSVGNYVGFVSILWTTWFHCTIFDVRFFTDSMLSRVFKIVSFLAMMSYTGLIPIYGTIDAGGMSRALTGMALVMMSLRFVFAVQYAIVFYFVRGFQKTFLPLLLMIVVYLLTGFAFLAIYLIDLRNEFTGTQGAVHLVRWYIVLAVEIVAVNLISSTWKVLSFRHTHLWERVGLLTLIVIGEGIIGLTKAVAYDLLGKNTSIWPASGLIVAAVIFIYFIYVLYFNQIENDHSEERWGSVRQQIWVMSHYFLHIAILLTVEGQAGLMTWNSCRQGINWFMSIYPAVRYPASGFTNNDELVSAVTDSVAKAAYRFHYYNMTDYYDPTSDLEALSNNSNLFNSSEWNATASEIMSDIRWNVQYYIFVNFQAEGPKSIDKIEDPAEKVFLYNQSFRVIFEYFYIGAGVLLIILAGMLWYGKRDKRKDEYWSIGIRTLIGLGLPFTSLIAFLETPGDMSSFRYKGCQWLIPIVLFCYLAVFILDNWIKVFFSMRRRYQLRATANAATNEKKSKQEAEMADENSKLVQSQDDHIIHLNTPTQESESTLLGSR